MCENLGLHGKPTTSYNPQGNSIVERIHQVMGNLLRNFELEDRDLDPILTLSRIPQSLCIWH